LLAGAGRFARGRAGSNPVVSERALIRAEAFVKDHREEPLRFWPRRCKWIRRSHRIWGEYELNVQADEGLLTFRQHRPVAKATQKGLDNKPVPAYTEFGSQLSATGDAAQNHSHGN